MLRPVRIRRPVRILRRRMRLRTPLKSGFPLKFRLGIRRRRLRHSGRLRIGIPPGKRPGRIGRDRRIGFGKRLCGFRLRIERGSGNGIGTGFEHGFVRRVERKHRPEVDGHRSRRRLRLRNREFRKGFHLRKAHRIVERPQFFQRQVAFEGRNLPGRLPAVDNRGQLAQFGTYRLQIHHCVLF